MPLLHPHSSAQPDVAWRQPPPLTLPPHTHTHPRVGGGFTWEY